MANGDPNLVHAEPTKEFFISMLTVDVTLTRAIIDLVDNSVDGANKTRGEGQRLDGLEINIHLSPEKFSVCDNCGGFDVDTARNYAFLFGRPKGAVATKGEVGRFGVGMKRTIFKLGNEFLVESTTENSAFLIKENVSEWLEKPEWEFHFSKIVVEKPQPTETIGTRVEVWDLDSSISQDLSRDFFINTLRAGIEHAHSEALRKGLSISINGTYAKSHDLMLLQSNLITSAFHEEVYYPQGDSGEQVRIKIYAGITKERNLEFGGWYIYCNGRLVLAADHTQVTGWGRTFRNEEEDDDTTPKYHTDFAFFRGYVFFESNDSRLLPLTTTKTGVDTDASIYKMTLQKMQIVLLPIRAFLRDYGVETGLINDGAEDCPLHTAVEEANNTTLGVISSNRPFNVQAAKPNAPTTVSIQYSRPKSDVDKVKATIGAGSAREAGLKTFEFYLKNECEE